MSGQDMQERDRAVLRHDHIFLGGSHDAHERRTRWVVALTALMMVGEQGHRSEQAAGDDLDGHHQCGQDHDPAGSPFMGVVAAAEEDVVVAEPGAILAVILNWHSKLASGPGENQRRDETRRRPAPPCTPVAP